MGYIYKDSFEYPYTERVGNGVRMFKDDIVFLTFLREEEEASTMWMTHVCLQAASTMLNLKIKVLTTGISPSSSYRCIRCTPPTTFDTEANLVTHKELVHNRTETEEDKGRNGTSHGHPVSHFQPIPANSSHFEAIWS